MKIKSAILLLCFFLMTWINNTPAQDFKEVDKTFQIDKNGEVKLDTYKGDVTIETWDKAEVHVYAKMIPDDSGNWFGSTDPEEQLENVDVDLDASANYVKITSDYRKSHSWFGEGTRALVNYKIQMPKTAKLNVKDYKSEIKITGVQSAINFETYKGETTVYGLVGSIDLETYKGQVRVEFSKLTDNCRFDTYKGEIKISLPKNTAFTVDADFGRRTDFNSDFNIETVSSHEKRHDYNFRREVNGGGPEIKLSSNKGEISLYER